MADTRKKLMALIARKQERHKSVVVERRALIRATTRQLRRECRVPVQPQLPL